MTALSVAAMATNAPTGGYPTVEVLGAFKQACSELSSFDAGESTVAAANWDSAESTDPNSELASLTGVMKANATRFEGSSLVQSQAHFRLVAGRPMYLMLSRIRAGEAEGIQCQMFDFGVDLSFSRDVAEKWIGREPTETAVGTNGFWGHWWTPGMQPNHPTLLIEYLPSGSRDDRRSIKLLASTMPLPKQAQDAHANQSNKGLE